MLSRRDLLALAAASLSTTLRPRPSFAQARTAEHWEEKLIAAARAQIGVTVRYDPAYVSLAYPGGDVDRQAGVCTDVIVRAYRDGLGHDLQQAIHDDMARAFKAYPKNWGLNSTDRNIDHRRVGNQATFFARHGRRLDVPDDPLAFAPGDLVTQTVGVNLPHIVIVSDRLTADGARPLVIHNIGRGTQEEDTLTAWPITGRYRYQPEA